MAPEISSVEARPNHRLLVRFENGECRLFDVGPYLDKGVFRELRDEPYFRAVQVIWGGVAWPHEQDLSADTLYLGGTPVSQAGNQRGEPAQASRVRSKIADGLTSLDRGEGIPGEQVFAELEAELERRDPEQHGT